MNAMTWVKGAVVAMGLSIGGSALAAGPFPGSDSAGLRSDDRDGRDRHDGQRYDDRDWNDRWTQDDHGYMDRHERALFRTGLRKIQDGKALQARGHDLLERSRWSRWQRARGYRLIERGEALEREGRMLIWRARS